MPSTFEIASERDAHASLFQMARWYCVTANNKFIGRIFATAAELRKAVGPWATINPNNGECTVFSPPPKQIDRTLSERLADVAAIASLSRGAVILLETNLNPEVPMLHQSTDTRSIPDGWFFLNCGHPDTAYRYHIGWVKPIRVATHHVMCEIVDAENRNRVGEKIKISSSDGTAIIPGMDRNYRDFIPKYQFRAMRDYLERHGLADSSGPRHDSIPIKPFQAKATEEADVAIEPPEETENSPPSPGCSL